MVPPPGRASMLRRRWKRLADTVPMSVRVRRIVGRRNDEEHALGAVLAGGAEEAPDDRDVAKARGSALGRGAVVGDQPAEHDGAAVVGQDRGLDQPAVGDDVGGVRHHRVADRGDLLAHVELDALPWLTCGMTLSWMPMSCRSMVVKGSVAVAAGGVGAGAERHVLADQDRRRLVVERGDARRRQQVGLGRLRRAPGSGCRTCPPPTARWSARSRSPRAERHVRGAAGCCRARARCC